MAEDEKNAVEFNDEALDEVDGSDGIPALGSPDYCWCSHYNVEDVSKPCRYLTPNCWGMGCPRWKAAFG